MHQQNLQHKINKANYQIQTMLLPVEHLSQEQSQSILRRYVAAIEKNFQYWLATTLVSSCSTIGRAIAEENFRTEVQEDHCSMLRHFGISAGAEPDATDYNLVADAVEQIDHLVAELSGIKCITLMAALENENFLYPYLAKLAQKVGSQNFEYTDIHRAEDSIHAAEFFRAFTAEIELGHEQLEQQIDKVLDAVVKLHYSIFQLNDGLT